jgi:uncharacterized OB-fold protein
MSEIPIKEGLFRLPQSPDGQPHLLGSRCVICGYTCFPKAAACVRCCRNDTMEEIELGPYAKLETFAVMQVGLPDFPAPYIIAYVRTREGALVFTLVTGCEARDDALVLGEDMELVIDRIKDDHQGNQVIGWKFRPAR